VSYLGENWKRVGTYLPDVLEKNWERKMESAIRKIPNFSEEYLKLDNTFRGYPG
jgi:hypothetical protein